MISENQDKKPLFLTGIFIHLLLFLWFVFHSGRLVSSFEIADSTNFRIVFLAYIFLLLSIFLLIGEGLYFVLKLYPRNIVWRFYRNFYLIWLSIIIIACVFEVKMFGVMGSHIYDPFIVQSIINPGLNKEIHFNAATYFSIGIFLLFSIALPRAIFILSRRHLINMNLNKVKFLFPTVTVVCIVFLIFCQTSMIQIEGALPLFEESGFAEVIREKSIPIEIKGDAPDLREDYRKAIKDTTQRIKVRKNILFIVVESFRSDMMHTEYTPNLSRLYDSLSTVKSDAHFSGSHVTETGVFSILYGINSANYWRFTPGNTPSLGLEILKTNGYRTVAVSSCPLSNWHGSGFMTKGFDDYKEISTGSPEEDDKHALEYLQNSYSKKDSLIPVCYFLFLNSTHHNYYYPKEFEISKPVMDKEYNHFLGDNSLRLHKEEIFNRYKNSVRYVDYLINKAVGIFSGDLKNENLILVVTGDHGEEFWDKGFLGHGSSNLYNCRTRVPLLFHLPGLSTQHFLFTSHTLIFPTIIHFLTKENYSVYKQFFDADFLLDQPEDINRHALIFSSQYDFDHKLCFLNAQGKYWLKTGYESGSVTIKKMLTYGDEEINPVVYDSLFKKQIRDVYFQLKKY